MMATLPLSQTRDATRDRQRIMRDQIMCAIEDAGHALSPKEIQKRTGLNLCAIGMCVNHWPRYFAVEHCEKTHILSVDRHSHLKGI